MRTPQDRIMKSLTYRNIEKALDSVFGKKNWRPNHFWSDGNANDFYMAIDIGTVQRAAYICVGETHMTGMYSAGPGGWVSIAVPLNQQVRFIFPDHMAGDTVTHLVGTPEEVQSYRWGAIGSDVKDIAGYVTILKRWVDRKDFRSGASPRQ